MNGMFNTARVYGDGEFFQNKTKEGASIKNSLNCSKKLEM